MRTTLLTTIFLSVSLAGWSQIMIATDETPQQLIENTFMGQNLSISNIKFNGTVENAQQLRDQVGRFTNGLVGLNVDQGLIMATGNAMLAVGPNDEGSATMGTIMSFAGDPDLAIISAPGTVQNVCIIEFDFIPNGNTVLFEYIFASEEYPVFANSQFNDSFGLFISGPGISGPFTNGGINIATIPGTSLPVSINTLNNGNTNTGPCEYCEFYVYNGTGGAGSSTEIQYNATTTEFTASTTVTPGETYHIKLAIGNVGDNSLDSAMFLTAGSFRSANLLGTANNTIEKVKLYPNPANDFIRVSAVDNVSAVTIYDMQGRSLQQHNIGGSDMEIRIDNLTSGTYIVEFLLADNKRSSQKLVVR